MTKKLIGGRIAHHAEIPKDAGTSEKSVNAAGHKTEVLNEPPARTIVERELLWVRR